MDAMPGDAWDQGGAQDVARQWTSALMDNAWDQTDAGLAEVPPSPVTGLDLGDVSLAVVRVTSQLQSLERSNRRVPVVVDEFSDAILPVDLDNLVDPGGKLRTQNVGEWIDLANYAVGNLADSSRFSYDEVAVDQVRGALHDATLSLVTQRLLTFGQAQSIGPRAHRVTVHTLKSGLRVHWSLAIAWHPVVFGMPTPTVSSNLLDGRYLFGVDSANMSMSIDSGIFDIPQTLDVFLTVA
jgi:hypothetical protein